MKKSEAYLETKNNLFLDYNSFTGENLIIEYYLDLTLRYISVFVLSVGCME